MFLSEILKESSKSIEITGFTNDSRKVQPGYAFVCINGSCVDGHKFAKQANDNGASVIICERDLGLSNQLIVEDTKKAYAKMSAEYFGNPAKKLKIIGVTGTNGKTSTTHIIKSVLEKLGHKAGLIGTISHLVGDEEFPSNNTTPSIYEINELFKKMVDSNCEYAVMEVSSHALDQGRIEGITFDVGVFTNLTQDHLDYHKTMDNYLAAKLKLFNATKIAVLNYDDKYFEQFYNNISCKKITYSTVANDADYTAKSINYKPDGVDYELVSENSINRIKMAIPGKFTVYNSLAAAVALIQLGFSIDDVSSAIKTVKGVKGRAEIVHTNTDYTIVIDYAHTPDGLLNILNTFKDCPKNRLVVLFGCGGDRDKSKRSIMGEIAGHNADYVIVTSDNPRSEDPLSIIKEIVSGMKHIAVPYKIIVNRADAIKFAIDNAQPGDIIVLAGKGHETYQILDYGTIHLDEREIIRDILSQKS